MVSLPKDFLRTEEGERIERRDYEHGMFTTPRAMLESVVNDLILGQATPGTTIPQNHVISGFPVTADGTVVPAPPPPAGTVVYAGSSVVTVTRGVAVLGTRINGQVEQGLTLANGQTSRNQDISTLADGTYGVYVRLEFRDSSFQNRVFWNPLAPIPTETARDIATRRAEDWAMAIEVVSPGPEWMLVGQVSKTGTTLTVADQRQMLWDVSTSDGSVETIVDADWGGGTDRDDDRRTNGLQGLFQTLVAHKRQIQDIIGTKWYDNPPTSLTQVVSDLSTINATIAALGNTYLQRDGLNTMNSGATLNWVDGTGVIGSAQAVDRIQCRNFDGANDFTSAAGAEREVLNGGFGDDQQVVPDRSLLFEFQGFNDIGGGIFASLNNEHIRIYAAGDGVDSHADYFEIVVNAVFDATLQTWSRGDNTGQASSLVRFGVGRTDEPVFEVLQRRASAADTWNDTVDTTGGWKRLFSVGAVTYRSTYSAADCIKGIGASAGDLSFPQVSLESQPLTLNANNNVGVKQIFVPLSDIPDGAIITGANVTCDGISTSYNVAVARQHSRSSIVGNSLKTGTPTDAVAVVGTHAITVDETEAIRTIDRANYTYYIHISVNSSSFFQFRSAEVDWVWNGQ